MSADTATQLANLSDKIDRLTSLITGDKEPNKGVLIRLDRIEQVAIRLTQVTGLNETQKASKRDWRASFIIASVASILTVVVQWIGRKFYP